MYKSIVNQFKIEGWKHRYYYDLWQGLSHKFIKGNAVIRIPTNNVDIEDKYNDNSVLIGWHELYMEENLNYHLHKSGCSYHLINMVVNYIYENR